MPRPQWGAACAALAFLVLLPAPPAAADVTVTLTGTSSGGGLPAPGLRRDEITYLKGNRQRVDRGTTSTILDLDAGRLVVLDHTARTATIYRIADLQPKQQDLAQVRVDVEPTGKRRDVGGLSCQEAKVSVVTMDPRRGMVMPGMGLQTGRDVTTGSVWIAMNEPGAGEYRAFYRRLGEIGPLVTDFALARRWPAQAIAQAKLAVEVASRGIPCEAQLSSRSYYGPADLTLLSPNLSSGWKLKQISTEPIADRLFEVPADYATQEVGS
jgi:hypothetical protein